MQHPVNNKINMLKTTCTICVASKGMAPQGINYSATGHNLAQSDAF